MLRLPGWSTENIDGKGDYLNLDSDLEPDLREIILGTILFRIWSKRNHFGNFTHLQPCSWIIDDYIQNLLPN